MDPSKEEENPKPHGRRYPWDAWFKLKKFTLTPGVDFDSRPYGMAQTIRNVASARFHRRVSVSISSDGTITVVQGGRIPPKETAARKRRRRRATSTR